MGFSFLLNPFFQTNYLFDTIDKVYGASISQLTLTIYNFILFDFLPVFSIQFVCLVIEELGIL